MKIVFLSNYFNHHQRALCDELYKVTDGNYKFIVTEEMSEERKNLGWGERDIPPYVIEAHTDEARAAVAEIIYSADVVMYGSAPMQMIKSRLKARKLTFYYSERRYREKLPFYKYPLKLLRDLKNIVPYRNFYLLAASAYAPRDYAMTGAFVNKAYKWGYFPEAKRYENVGELIENKKPGTLLWAGRFIELKHPEMPIKLAKRLKSEGYAFSIKMLGNGVMLDDMRALVESEGLDDVISLPGAVSPNEVREAMEQSRIFLFTSDRNEGWGAVINEAMNSACATVACRDIGSAPYLIKGNENGMLFESMDDESLYQKVKWLLDNPSDAARIGANAHRTIVEEWNAGKAAERLYALSEEILKTNKAAYPFDDDVCSKARNNIWG